MDMQDVNKIGDKIKLRRLELGLSQNELGRAIFGSGSYVSRIESGEFVDLRATTLRRLTGALRCTVDDLIPKE